MIRCTANVALLALTVSSVALGAAPAERIVSLDFCADQFVMNLQPRDRILAVSPDAARRIAREAARQPRLGARALKEIFRQVIGGFEFDPETHRPTGAEMIDLQQVEAVLTGDDG